MVLVSSSRIEKYSKGPFQQPQLIYPQFWKSHKWHNNMMIGQLDENVCCIHHQLVPIQANYFMFIPNGEPSFHIGIATTKSWNILRPSTSFGWNNFGTNQIICTLVNISLNDNEHFDGLNINSTPLLMGQGQVVSWLLPARPGSDTHGQQRPNALWMLSDSFLEWCSAMPFSYHDRPFPRSLDASWSHSQLSYFCLGSFGSTVPQLGCHAGHLFLKKQHPFFSPCLSGGHLCHHLCAPF